MQPDAEPLPPANTRKERKTAYIRVRMTPAEKQKIVSLAVAHNAELSDYVRARALKQNPKTAPTATGDRRALLEMLADFGKMRGNVKQIGHNLNDLARSGNRQRLVTDVTILHALKEIESLGDIFRNLLNESR